MYGPMAVPGINRLENYTDEQLRFLHDFYARGALRTEVARTCAQGKRDFPS